MSEKFDNLLKEVMGGTKIESPEVEPKQEEQVIEERATEEAPESTETVVEKKIEEVASQKKEETESKEPEYIPNFKYRVKDKEFELDEKARKYIKAKEDEEFFRDVYTKITGLDEIKIQRDKLREENAGISKEYQNASSKVKTLDYLENTLASGRYDDFMSTLQRAGLTGKELVKFAHSVAATLEKSPDQVERERLEFDRQRMEQERNAYSTESEDKYEKLNQELFEMKVETAINKPEIAAIAKQFNEKFGEGVSGKGAFIDEVAKEGMLYFQQSGQVGDPSTVVESVAKKLGAFLQPVSSASNTSGTKPPLKTKTIISANKNLPNINGSSDTTSLGKSNMTISQMEKHFQEELARRR